MFWFLHYILKICSCKNGRDLAELGKDLAEYELHLAEYGGNLGQVWMTSSRVWMTSSRVWMKSSWVCIRSSRVWMRSSWVCGWDLERLTANAKVATVLGSILKSSDVRHSGIWECIWSSVDYNSLKSLPPPSPKKTWKKVIPLLQRRHMKDWDHIRSAYPRTSSG